MYRQIEKENFSLSWGSWEYVLHRKIFGIATIGQAMLVVGIEILALLQLFLFGIGEEYWNSYTGRAGALLILTALFTIPYTSPVDLLGMSRDRRVQYHIVFNTLAFITLTGHASYELIAWGVGPPYQGPFGIVIPMFGFLAYCCFCVIFIASIVQPIRRRFYAEWHIFHVVMSTAIIVLAILHTNYNRWFLLPGFLLYMALYAWGSLIKTRRNRTIAKAKMVGNNIVKVTVPFEAKVLPAQFSSFSIPALSVVDAHPFSLIPNEQKDEFDIYCHVTGQGRWVSRLAKLVSSAPNQTTELSLSFTDPAGTPMQAPLPSYPSVIMICGGAGVTATISWLQDITERIQDGDYQIKNENHVMFVWSTRNIDLVKELWPVLEAAANAGIAVQVNLTKEAGEDDDATSLRDRHQSIVVKVGQRINFQELEASLFDWFRDGTKIVGGFVCATPGIADQVRHLSTKLPHMHLHTATYEW